MQYGVPCQIGLAIWRSLSNWSCNMAFLVKLVLQHGVPCQVGLATWRSLSSWSCNMAFLVKLVLQHGVPCQVGQQVQKECRRTYSRPKPKPAYSAQSLQSCPHKLRSSNEGPAFSFQTMCFFCGTSTSVNSDDSVWLRSFDCQYRLSQIAAQRNDEWGGGGAVRERMSHTIDMPAAGAMYHPLCNVNFRTYRSIPLKYSSHTNARRRSFGRPIDESKLPAFHMTIDWLENNEDDMITVALLHRTMKEFMTLVTRMRTRVLIPGNISSKNSRNITEMM